MSSPAPSTAVRAGPSPLSAAATNFLPIAGQVPAVLPHRFTVEQVESMIESGVLTKSDRCELIRGELIEKIVLGDPHMAAVKRLNRWFNRAADTQYVVGVQDAIKLKDSRPEPDVTLLKYRADFYRSQTPTPADILLLIEVADSTLLLDKQVKLSLYAENGIQEYWIVNLIDDCIEVHRQPQSAGTYADRQVIRRGERLSPIALPDLSLSADDILGLPSAG
jgi:Uma2 family endonuclease